ncbi:Basic Proline-rich Protein 1 [Hibiscus trionum]|uniref:Basic Proline-rich Protein 1 n=1 Tax=Hibiscus trionum TaxID=183268 RepID=A0A9W7HRM5_HIBTR|nr:Basic Proline-rich Protein 1 [Hibiscus trionum]
MVERMINRQNLAPPKQDDNHSPHANLSAKSSSPNSSGFEICYCRGLQKFILFCQDIRQCIPGNLGPLMMNIPASSMYNGRSGPTRCRTVTNAFYLCFSKRILQMAYCALLFTLCFEK